MTFHLVVRQARDTEDEGLSPSYIALSFDGFGSISWYSIQFFQLLYSFQKVFVGFPTFSARVPLKKLKIFEMGLTAGVTGQQRMLTPPRHLILLSHLSEVRVALHSIL
jgi:hypothetical protein